MRARPQPREMKHLSEGIMEVAEGLAPGDAKYNESDQAHQRPKPMASSADDALIGSVILASLSSGCSAMAPPLLQLNDSEYTGCFFLRLRNGCVDA